ncbi:MAG TPA: 3' terminal RNA ribose 2'-O-methyltransferase Hen1 [Ktedonobacterales bacterium]|nr:3' terminal RNA ribose 2'-O-methyltransferase Hen1 [Ktedonobacterales bacterium]
MLITFTCEAPDAPDIGYLLGKNPASVFRREFSAGTVWVFYPEVSEQRVTIALVTEIDAVGLVRGPAALTSLDSYVNDRPYVASSLTSVALNTAFGTALAGHFGARAERAAQPLDWTVRLPAVACDAGEDLITRIFAPLGYAVTCVRLPLDARFLAWGPASIYDVTLTGKQTVQRVLSHLYVLLPVLDNSKHYFVGAAESEKLLAHGGDWLAAHPERELIARRYLRYKRPLVQSALARLAEKEDQAEADASGETSNIAPIEPEPASGLHEQRLQAVMAAIRESGAHTLADLGCGEGRLLELALKEKSLTRIIGMDVSSIALARARRRLHLDTMPPAQRARIEIAQGSLLYRDRRIEGFDAAALVEVIEHLDTPRLEAMERVVFVHARPRRVIVTTPNREYNVHWEAVGAERLRHGDHRFEWTRAECDAWAGRVAAATGYRYARQDIGPADGDLGAPSQMVIFDRVDGN